MFNQFLLIGILDPYTAGVRQHFHHGRTDIREGHIASSYRQSWGIQNQISEPNAHGAIVAEDTLKNRLHGREIEQRLIDVEDD